MYPVITFRNLGFSSYFRLFIDFSDSLLTFLVDTGAPVSILKAECLPNLSQIVCDNIISVNGIKDEDVFSLGSMEITVSIFKLINNDAVKCDYWLAREQYLKGMVHLFCNRSSPDISDV